MGLLNFDTGLRLNLLFFPCLSLNLNKMSTVKMYMYAPFKTNGYVNNFRNVMKMACILFKKRMRK